MKISRTAFWFKMRWMRKKGWSWPAPFEPLSKAVVKQIAELGVTKIKVVDTSVDEGIIIKCLKKDPAKNEEEGLKDIYRRLRPGDPPTAQNAGIPDPAPFL